MNARSHIFELPVEAREIEEVVGGIFHTLLFHRTLGKFHFKHDGLYSIGSVGMTDVDCDFVDFTYVKCTSDELDKLVKKDITAFRDAIRNNDSATSGQICLEFYQKKPTRWPFPSDNIPWEVWFVKLDMVTLTNEYDRQLHREKVSELLAEKVMYMAEAMNRNDYVPKIPNQSDLESVFETSLTDVQPYLFKISYQTDNDINSSSVSTTMKRFFKDTLAF